MHRLAADGRRGGDGSDHLRMTTRRLVDGQPPVVGEIGLLAAVVVDGELAIQGCPPKWF